MGWRMRREKLIYIALVTAYGDHFFPLQRLDCLFSRGVHLEIYEKRGLDRWDSNGIGLGATSHEGSNKNNQVKCVRFVHPFR